MKHIVNLVVSNPSHEFVSLRARTHQKSYLQEAHSPEEAINRATRHFRTLGFMVHSATIQEQKVEQPTPKAAPQVIAEDVAGVLAAQVKQKIAQNKARSEVDKSEVQDKAGKAQAGSALAQYLKKKAETMKEEVEVVPGYLEEKLTAADPASKWIHDFVHSDNPKFEGKSKKERINMALGAKYAADRALKEDAEQVEEGRAMDYKMSRSSVAGDRGDSKGGEINVSQKDREEIAKILGAKDDKKQDKKLEENAGLEEAVSRKDFKQVAGIIKEIPDAAKRKEIAQHHAEIFANQNPRFDRSRFYAAAGVNLGEEAEQVEEAKADPVAKAKELLDQAEKGTYKGSAAKLQKALEKAKSRNFDQGKGYKLEEGAEQLDETGVVKKTNKTLKNVMAAAKGARLKAQNPEGIPAPEPQHKTAQAYNKALGRAVMAMTREEAEGTTPTTPKEKELAAKAGDPNKITKKDVLAARGVKLDEVKGSFKDQATEKAETERLEKQVTDKKGAAKEATNVKKAKATETLINLAKSKKNKINVTPTLDHNKGA